MAETQNTPAPRMMFVNLPVANLDKSVAFFTALGFTFNPQFTDENATCMIVGKDAFVMLLVEPYFKTFTKRSLCDTRTHSEALIAVSCESREAVEQSLKTALAHGAKPATEGSDQGFMIVRTFYDLDGHHWEFMWMDPSAMQQG
jgi:predicted lactoylglutathione lyase